MSGATGPYAKLVNGTFTSTKKRLNGMIVYSKLGDVFTCLYFATNKKWFVASMANAKAGNDRCYAQTEIGLSHPSLAKKWQIWNGEEWQQQPVVASVMVSVCVEFLKIDLDYAKSNDMHKASTNSHLIVLPQCHSPLPKR